jgi:membrane protease YdiL (CAAX protease family)
VALSLILSFVYEKTGRSLLLPVLLHACVNTFAGPLRVLPSVAGSERPFILTVLLAWIAAGLLAALPRR